MPKTKKLFYLPGQISLILLPLFSLTFLFNSIKPKDNLIEIYITDSLSIKEFRSITIDYTIDGNEDHTNIDHALRECITLIISKDTLRSIRVHYSNMAKYNSLIYLLDLCIKHGINSYSFDNSNVYLYYHPYCKYDYSLFNYDFTLKEL